VWVCVCVQVKTCGLGEPGRGHRSVRGGPALDPAVVFATPGGKFPDGLELKKYCVVNVV